jgi:hypothetical protein
VEYHINLKAAHAKMRLKNEILPKLQETFEDAYKNGEILTLKEALLVGANDWSASLEKELSA